MTLKYIWRSFSLGCHFHVHFSYPWHAFASHGLPAIAELLVDATWVEVIIYYVYFYVHVSLYIVLLCCAVCGLLTGRNCSCFNSSVVVTAVDGERKWLRRHCWAAESCRVRMQHLCSFILRWIENTRTLWLSLLFNGLIKEDSQCLIMGLQADSAVGHNCIIQELTNKKWSVSSITRLQTRLSICIY